MNVWEVLTQFYSIYEILEFLKISNLSKIL